MVLGKRLELGSLFWALAAAVPYVVYAWCSVPGMCSVFVCGLRLVWCVPCGVCLIYV